MSSAPWLGHIAALAIFVGCGPNSDRYDQMTQPLSGQDATPALPLDARGVAVESATMLVDPPVHSKGTNTEKPISHSKLVVQIVHRYSKHASTIAHVRATNVLGRRAAGTPPALVTDFDYTVVELAQGPSPPPIRLTAAGGQLNGIVEIAEHAPRVSDGGDFIAFFMQKKGQWTLLGLIPSDPSGTVIIAGEYLTLAQLLSVAQ